MWGPIGILAGGIIGAGVFSLPYAVSQSGLLIGFVLLALAATAYCIIHLMYADVAVGISEQHRFVGYIKMYLGERWSYAAILMAVVEMVCVLTIYLILSATFVKIILPATSELFAIVVFWFFGSATMFLKLRRLATVETIVLAGILAIMVALFLCGVPYLNNLKDVALVGSGNVLLPLSAIFFALSGRVAIPPLVNYFRLRTASSKKEIRRAVVIGTLIPAVSYAVFIAAVLALSGSVSQDSIAGIVSSVPHWLMLGVGVLGLLSLWSSYILVGLDVSDTLKYDLDIPLWLRLVVVCLAPLMLYLAGFTSLIGLISFVGGVFLALEGMFIVLLWREARERKKLGGLIAVTRPTLLFLWIVFLAALVGVLIAEYHP